MLPRHFHCVFCGLRCNVRSLVINCYLCRNGGVKNIQMSVLSLLCLCYAYYAYSVCTMLMTPTCIYRKTKTGIKIYITAKYYSLFYFQNYAINELVLDRCFVEFESSNFYFKSSAKKTELIWFELELVALVKIL